jgi:predicted negative regulator of RcsB-dependent stress response
MKRIKRKQLKGDEFVTTVNKIVRFVKERTTQLVALLVLVLVVVIIFAGVRIVKGQNRERQSKLLAQILDLRSGLDSHPENEAKLEALAGGREFSRMVYLLLANYWVEKGDDAKAKTFLEKMPEDKKDILYYQAQDLLAQILSRQKDYDKAINIYKKIEGENPKVYSLDVILFHRAELHEKKGELAEALILYKRVQDEFPQTYYSLEASQKVRELEAKK